jgi:hypothetical protein
MTKRTVYLPDSLDYALVEEARQRNVSEDEVIREAVQALVGERPGLRPRVGRFHWGGGLAEHVDEALVGFGEW